MPHKDEDRGQVGIGTLIVFIAMVLVAAIAAGVLINTAGFLQSQSEQTGQQSSAQVSDRLQVVNTVGDQVNSQQISVINMTVKKAPGAGDIDLTGVTLQYVSDSEIVDLVHTDSPEASAGSNFETDTIQDDDSSIADSTVLNAPEDRAVLALDIGPTDDLTVDTSNVGPLGEGDTASIQVTTQAGGETTVTITVPDSLTGKSAVTL